MPLLASALSIRRQHQARPGDRVKHTGVRKKTASGAGTGDACGSGSKCDIAPPLQQVNIPHTVATRLESWGPTMLLQVRSAFARWATRRGIAAGAFNKVRIGTDCSGADAPVWALKVMGVPHEHVFSCDVLASARALILANSRPAVMFNDMLRRCCDNIPDVDVYVSGFPCQPYSLLRGKHTKFFRESAAKPYRATLDVLRTKRPPLAILENVKGIGRVMRKVVRDLESTGGYMIFVIPIDSADLAEPVGRPRFYFLLLRCDVAIASTVGDVAEFIHDALVAVKAPVVDGIESLMLPAHHPLVRASLEPKGPVKPRAATTKWRAKHKSIKVGSGDRVIGLTERQSQVYQHSVSRGHGDVVVDVSQSIERAHPHFGGTCGTVTPGGKIMVQRLQRSVLPLEKLMLHLFPVHRMRFPPMSDADLNLLGGNTMHLKAVGFVLAVGLCLLRPSHRVPTGRAEGDVRCKAFFLGATTAAKRAKRQVLLADRKRRRLLA